ncbi:RAMP superfamily CRISPR-associated protein [Propionivibrio sp.]|uniref:RAMP superfamily CRISPR-associated protein n=1 Tax=Propionivibrio sp. TaxID=2212460 RepID=UPI003BEF9A73
MTASDTIDTPQKTTRQPLPMWRVQGIFTLTTPLSLGTGQDETLTSTDQDNWVSCIARDHRGEPYLSGSGIKGALRALARRSDLPPDLMDRLFGSANGDQTTPAQLEICNAYLLASKSPGASPLPGFDPQRRSAMLMHSVRNRDYGTAEHRLLFTEQVAPPGCQFRFECSAHGLDEADIAHLLGLLQLAGAALSSFQLGSRQASDNGRVTWQLAEVRRLNDLHALWRAVQTQANAAVDLWAGAAQPHVHAKTLTQSSDELLLLTDLALRFHTPFLVYEANKAKKNVGDPDGVPRKNSAGQAVLPDSSLHGALRSQAERILRTLGEETPAGYKVPAVFGLDNVARLDLASVLFGATGWRAVVQCSDFLAPKDAPTLKHEMVAIDRITGGGKDSAKFSIQALDCPTLTGSIRLDLGRLRKLQDHNPDLVSQVLGLLAHVLRDLDEGDIALGYGKAKGYGACTAGTVKTFKDCLDKTLTDLTCALTAFAANFKDPQEPHQPLSNAANIQAPTGPDLGRVDGDFHNPYVFIPFGTDSRIDQRLPWERFQTDPKKQIVSIDNKTHHSHASYAPNAYNGRLVCHVIPQTPFFVGAGDAEDVQLPKLKEPFKLNQNLALPATSLRGMLSSLHESITRSRMRVMDDRRYSTRTPMEQALSAVGRLMKIGGGYWIQMMALPTLEIGGNNRAVVPREYRALLTSMRSGLAPLKSLFGDVQNAPLPDGFSTYSPTASQSSAPWYMVDTVKPMWQDDRGQISIDIDNPNGLHIKNAGHRRFLLGVRRTQVDLPIKQADAVGRAGLQAGYLRIMDAPGRDLVDTRKHELFVPCNHAQRNVPSEIKKRITEGQEKLADIDLTKDYQLLPIPNEVIDRFCRLADEMTATQDNKPDLSNEHIRPYQPVGLSRGEVGKTDLRKPERALRPKHGDLVYFRPATDGKSIAEIGYSSLWRKELEKTAAEWVPAHVRPLSMEAIPSKTVLSPSELLFGFVQCRDEKKTEPQSKDIMAFASKVRFGFGQFTNKEPQQTQDPVTLKILASPKPPSPAMYFTGGTLGANASYVAKLDLLKDPGGQKLKGRKAYLSALRTEGGLAVQAINPLGEKGGKLMPWQSAHPDDEDTKNQKVRINPLSGGEFYFETDFVNLSTPEVESLCATLMPHAGFEYKLGMGKPLGLGSVKVDVIGMFLVNRVTRYRETAFDTAKRYAQVWKNTSINVSLPPHLSAESQAEPVGNCPSPVDLAHTQMQMLKQKAQDIFNAIVLTGNPKAVTKPVHYPQLRGQDIEEETFKWFVNNDYEDRNYTGESMPLGQFNTQSNSLPALTRGFKRDKK